MRFIGMRVFALSVAVLMVGCAGQQTREAPAADPAAARSAVDSLNQAFQGAVAGRDSNLLATFYADDARLLPPNAPMLQGRDAIRGFWAQFISDTSFSVSIQSMDVLVANSGDMAVDVGSYSSRMPGGTQDTGKYVTVMRKVGDEWKIAIDTFNSDLPAPGQKR
jgi:ketosteroid isomerase-like protein